MATKLEAPAKDDAQIPRATWVGTSGEIKPYIGYQYLVAGAVKTVIAGDLPRDSTFTETDTGRVFRWDGQSQWIGPIEDRRTLDALAQISSQLASLSRLLADAYDLDAENY